MEMILEGEKKQRAVTFRVSFIAFKRTFSISEKDGWILELFIKNIMTLKCMIKSYKKLFLTKQDFVLKKIIDWGFPSHSWGP